jgi:hypothetical protein
MLSPLRRGGRAKRQRVVAAGKSARADGDGVVATGDGQVARNRYERPTWSDCGKSATSLIFPGSAKDRERWTTSLQALQNRI